MIILKTNSIITILFAALIILSGYHATFAQSEDDVQEVIWI